MEKETNDIEQAIKQAISEMERQGYVKFYSSEADEMSELKFRLSLLLTKSKGNA